MHSQLANECLMVSYAFLPSILQVWVAEGWQVWPDESFSKQIHLTMHGPLGGITVITALLSAQMALLVPRGF